MAEPGLETREFAARAFAFRQRRNVYQPLLVQRGLIKGIPIRFAGKAVKDTVFIGAGPRSGTKEMHTTSTGFSERPAGEIGQPLLEVRKMPGTDAPGDGDVN